MNRAGSDDLHRHLRQPGFYQPYQYDGNFSRHEPRLPTERADVDERHFRRMVDCGGAQFTADTVVSASITVYAKWSLPMVPVPAGAFQRDSDPDNTSTISTAFKMSATEITRDQFVAVMDFDPDSATAAACSGTSDPVQKVNWYHTLVFCNMLSIKEDMVALFYLLN